MEGVGEGAGKELVRGGRCELVDHLLVVLDDLHLLVDLGEVVELGLGGHQVIEVLLADHEVGVLLPHLLRTLLHALPVSLVAPPQGLPEELG